MLLVAHIWKQKQAEGSKICSYFGIYGTRLAWSRKEKMKKKKKTNKKKKKKRKNVKKYLAVGTAVKWDGELSVASLQQRLPEMS